VELTSHYLQCCILYSSRKDFRSGLEHSAGQGYGISICEVEKRRLIGQSGWLKRVKLGSRPRADPGLRRQCDNLERSNLLSVLANTSYSSMRLSSWLRISRLLCSLHPANVSKELLEPTDTPRSDWPHTLSWGCSSPFKLQLCSVDLPFIYTYVRSRKRTPWLTSALLTCVRWFQSLTG
jgi:hypothetical protein